VTIFLAVNLDFLQKFLGTTGLTPDQWAICIVVPLSLVVVEEVRKLLKIRTSEPAIAPVAAAASAA